jgi:sulfoacetaldehyde dehydrogenase
MTQRAGAIVADVNMEEARKMIAAMVARARAAQAIFGAYSQEQVDEVVAAIGWAVYKQERAKYLAELECRETGMGNVEDKTLKNYHRTKGAVYDLMGKKSVGILDVDVEPGVTRIAKPIGVVGALTPCTNAAAGTVGNALMISKCRNAVIFAPNPRSKKTSDETIRLIREQLARIGAPVDIVQGISEPTKEVAQELMRQVDCIVATGGQAMVKAAYSSGKPSFGVGVGNAVVIVDETADVADAAEKVKLGKIFDYASSCSSENSVIVQESVYDRFMAELVTRGGYLVNAEEKERLRRAMWEDGALSARIICKSPREIADVAGLASESARGAKFFIVPETGYGPEHPFSGEKISVVLAAYKYRDFDDAVALVNNITSYQGRGHSCGIHSTNEDHILKLAGSVRLCRVLVNQAQAYGNSGNFNNGLPFTATLGCGTWGNNSVSENLTYKHMMNVTRLARLKKDVKTPTEEEVFGEFLKKWGDH